MKDKTHKKYTVSIIFFILVVLFFSGCKPNDKLVINKKKQTISLGEIRFGESSGKKTMQIEVLADGEPMFNPSLMRKIIIDGKETSSDSIRFVKMILMTGDKVTFANSAISNEDGKFMFYIEEEPDKIAVFTGNKTNENVYFNARTKEVISQKEFYPSL